RRRNASGHDATALTGSSAMNRILAAALALILAGSTATAAPVLRSDVTVIARIVTVGDRFDDAGLLAPRAMFRAPLPGTTGTVDLEAVRQAAALAGLSEYDDAGVDFVRVTRAATVVDANVLTDLITTDLRIRGIAGPDVTVQAAFDQPGIA